MIVPLYKRIQLALLAALLAFAAGPASAGEADIVGAKVTRTSSGVYRFDVTVTHFDRGWKHYANKWDVVAPDGTVLGTRELLHPHEHEQPFTRSLSGVRVPKGIATVTLRAHDLVHEYGGKEMTVKIPE